MLDNGYRVTNHALVKHFKRFLTKPETQHEARKMFKAYVNLLATIKNENDQKYLILRKKYINECPSPNLVDKFECNPTMSDVDLTPPRHPPPYKYPQQVSSPAALSISSPAQKLTKENDKNSCECHDTEYSACDEKDHRHRPKTCGGKLAENFTHVSRGGRAFGNIYQPSLEVNGNKKNTGVSLPSSISLSLNDTSLANEANSDWEVTDNLISVKDVTKKFNRLASEEVLKVISPTKKNSEKEKILIEEKISTDLPLTHPKTKDWIVSMAKANYQELAKLANEFPELVQLQDPSTGYTALHWAAKHGNEDVIKLIAGSYQANVNAKTNGGYTPLHLAVQFGQENIFELLCNIYKANRDLMDWSGMKPLDYLREHTGIRITNTTRAPPKRTKNFSYSLTSSTVTSGPLTRTQSMMTSGRSTVCPKNLSLTSNKFAGEQEKHTANIKRTASSKVHREARSNSNRKESFFRKTLRVAAESNKPNIPVVAEENLTE